MALISLEMGKLFYK